MEAVEGEGCRPGEVDTDQLALEEEQREEQRVEKVAWVVPIPFEVTS